MLYNKEFFNCQDLQNILIINDYLVICSRVDTSTIGTLQRVQILIEHLLSDKQAFKAMNPGCVLGDFARWCSIDNWKEDGGVKTTNEVGH